MLDMFEVDGGLKAQSLSKVVFSEMRELTNGENQLIHTSRTKKTNKTNFV